MLIGCCGMQGRRAEYVREFPVIEVQRSFYQLPRMSLAEKWRSEAPEGFTYAIKEWQLVTHRATSPTYRRVREELQHPADDYGAFQNTAAVHEAWDRTRVWATALGARIVVFQCPRSFRPDEESVDNLKAFFETCERDDLDFVWEPRGWPDEIVADLCEQLDLVHCVDPFIDAMTIGSFAYFRLHGRPAYQYRYRFTDEDLEEIEGFVADAAERGRDPIYVMFNNWWLHEDALRYKAMRSGGRRGSRR